MLQILAALYFPKSVLCYTSYGKKNHSEQSRISALILIFIISILALKNVFFLAQKLFTCLLKLLLKFVVF